MTNGLSSVSMNFTALAREKAGMGRSHVQAPHVQMPTMKEDLFTRFSGIQPHEDFEEKAVGLISQGKLKPNDILNALRETVPFIKRFYPLKPDEMFLLQPDGTEVKERGRTTREKASAEEKIAQAELAPPGNETGVVADGKFYVRRSSYDLLTDVGKKFSPSNYNEMGKNFKMMEQLLIASTLLSAVFDGLETLPEARASAAEGKQPDALVALVTRLVAGWSPEKVSVTEAFDKFGEYGGGDLNSRLGHLSRFFEYIPREGLGETLQTALRQIDEFLAPFKRTPQGIAERLLNEVPLGGEPEEKAAVLLKVLYKNLPLLPNVEEIYRYAYGEDSKRFATVSALLSGLVYEGFRWSPRKEWAREGTLELATEYASRKRFGDLMAECDKDVDYTPRPEVRGYFYAAANDGIVDVDGIVKNDR